MDQTLAGQTAPAVVILGCGQLGQAIGLLLAARAITCVGIKRTPLVNAHLPGNFRVTTGDIARPATYAQWLSADTREIIVCPTPDQSTDEAYRATYVKPLRALLTHLAEHNLSARITFISSTSVFGQAQGESVDETSITQPAGFNGQRLLEAESLLLDHAHQARHLVLRLSGIYSESRTRLLDKLCRGESRQPDTLTNRIHLQDAARATVYLMNQPALKAQRYCVTDDLPARESEILEWLARQNALTSRPLTADSVPQAPSKIPPSANIPIGKAISNARLRAEGFTLLYPNFVDGYGQILRNRI